MKKIGIFLAVLLFAPSFLVAQSIGLPQQINLRYNAQISNAPAGTCGCFALQGGGLDANWNLFGFDKKTATLGVVADFDVVHTATVSNANYGLTLSTFTFGPRVTVPAKKKIEVFGQTLFGLAYGSGSQFPSGDTLIPSASSFALNLGAGGDYQLNKRISIRVLQLDYVRTQLPNTSSNWQNNLRVGSGVTLNLHP